jgi:hypothetical protein
MRRRRQKASPSQPLTFPTKETSKEKIKMLQPPTDAFANLGISAPAPPACSSGSSVASSTTLGLVGDIPTAITTATAGDRLVVGVDFGTTYSGYVLLLFN